MKSPLRISISRGTRYQCGLQSGRQLALAIIVNLGIFWQAVEDAGFTREQLVAWVDEDKARLSPELREEIKGMAAGCGLEYYELLAYNLYRGWLACDC